MSNTDLPIKKLPQQDRAEKLAQEYSKGLVSKFDLMKATNELAGAIIKERAKLAAPPVDSDLSDLEFSREKLLEGADASGKIILLHMAERLLLPNRDPLDEIYHIGTIIDSLEDLLSPSEFDRLSNIRLLANDECLVRDADPQLTSEEARKLRELIVLEAAKILQRKS